MGVCAYRLSGRCRVRPDLDMPGESEDLAATTPVHDPEIKVDFCRLFSKERDVHRPVVVGAEAEGRKARVIELEVGNAGCRVANAISVSRMLTTTVFRCSQQNIRPFAPAFQATKRTYALSRFPQRSPGVGRRRQHVENDDYRTGTSGFRPAHEEVPQEAQPSSETSPLWQESARSTNSDPAEGLRRLLMTHESLIVTRLACGSAVLGETHSDTCYSQPDRNAQHICWF
jgi:hypothetical protein